MHPVFPIRALSLGLALALSAPALAEPLAVALDAAWRRDPEARALEAGAGFDTARRAEAARLLADAPELEARHWRERDGEGGEETELDLSLGLRWPGERAADRSLAEAEAGGRAAALAARRLALAGELREAAAELLAARAEEELAAARRRLAETLASDIAAQVKAGEKAETDRLLALGEALAARRAAQEAALRRQRAEGEWANRVGAGLNPPEAAETPAAAFLRERHPEWQALAAERARLLAEREAAEADGRETPRLILGARQERQPEAGRDTALSLGFSLPLGQRPTQGSRRAALEPRLAEADARLAALAGRLERERLQAETGLAQARELAALAAEQAVLAARQRTEARRALDLGELSLLDYTRLDAQAAEAERDAVLARLAEARAIARLNQTYGSLP